MLEFSPRITGSLNVDGDITVTGQSSGSFTGSFTGTLVATGNTSLQSAVVINESGGNNDFRVEGQNETHLLFTDASTDRVGIGTSSPNAGLEISKGVTGTAPLLRLTGTSFADNEFTAIEFARGTSVGASINCTPSNAQTRGNLTFNTGLFGSIAESMRIDSDGNVGIGTTSPSKLLEVNGEIDAGSIISDATDTGVVTTTNTRTVIASAVGQASATYSAVIGSSSSTASGIRSAVMASFDSTASSAYSAVIASDGCLALTSQHAVVIGSDDSTASGIRSAVMASSNNSTASGSRSAVMASTSGQASGIRSAVIGGDGSTASGNTSAVMASSNSTASGARSAVLSSLGSTASSQYSAVIASDNCDAETNEHAVVIGSENSTASGLRSGVYSSVNSTASGERSAVMSSINSTASGGLSAVIGSASGTASGTQSVVLSSSTGTASGDLSAVIGSTTSTASSTYSAVIASDGCLAQTNQHAVVIGSEDSTASGERSGVYSSVISTASGSRSAVIGSDRTVNSTNGSLALGSAGSGGASTANRTIHLFSQTGNVSIAGTLTQNASFTDFAEMMPNGIGEEIPAGTILTMKDGQVVPSNDEEICGVVSHTGAILAGDTPFCWQGRYLTDEFGRRIWETIPDPDWEAEIESPNWKAEIPNPDYVEEYDDEGNLIESDVPEMIPNPDPQFIPNPEPQKDIEVLKENPEWNPDLEQVKRSDRPAEWTPVGLLGQVFVRTAENVQAGDRLKSVNGHGVKSDERTGLKVMKVTKEYDGEYGIAKCLLNVMV